MTRSPRALAVLLCLVPSAAACVSADAGYADVRDLAAARLQKDVRWYEHDRAANASERTRELLGAPLDVDSAVQLALLNNPGLQASFEELGIARSQLVRALRLPNPSVDAALRYRGGDSSEPSVDVDALIDLTDLILLPIQSGASRAELDAAKISVAGAVLDLAFDTRRAFYRYQAAEQTLELRREILSALRASFEAAQALYAAGNITTLSYANERALYEEARIAFTAAEVSARARREELNGLLGLWGPRGAQWKTTTRLPTPADPPDVAQLEARSVERSLDLELERRRFAAAARRANVERARGWLPELSAGISAEREAEADASWSVGPAIALEVPLFYQGQGEVGVAQAQMRQSQRAYADIAIRLRAAARAAAAKLEAAAQSVAYYRDVVLPLRQQVLDETQLQYNAMSVGVFQLLQAKRDQIETGRAYVEALLEYWTARALVEQLLAGKLPGGGVDAAPVPTGPLRGAAASDAH